MLPRRRHQGKPTGPWFQRWAPAQPVPSCLLALPDPCLVAVLQCLAAEQDVHSLFHAARAHSRLHKAAGAALSSIHITPDGTGPWQQHQPQMDSLTQYLNRHGRCVSSIDVRVRLGATGSPCSLQLPPSLQHLRTLSLRGLRLQLQPLVSRDACQGLPAAACMAPPLEKLCLEQCEVPGGELPALLALLPGLQHLACTWCDSICPAGSTLRELQQLTHLQLFCRREPPGLHFLQALTRLQDLSLRLDLTNAPPITASTLSALTCLTRLEVYCNVTPQGEPMGLWLDSDALASSTQLRHLVWEGHRLLGAATVAVQLLPQLQHLQQLTHLEVHDSIDHVWDVVNLELQAGDEAPPQIDTTAVLDPTAAAAYSALTASSKLQHLVIDSCTLPAAAWQHVFPAGRQLPRLHVLSIGRTQEITLLSKTARGVVPDGVRLIICCPALQSLTVSRMGSPAQLLGCLRVLSGLRVLDLGPHVLPEEAWQFLRQLSGLRELHMGALLTPDPAHVLQLTQLQHLTCLECADCKNGACLRITSKDPGALPVWRQLLLKHVNHSDPQVARQAATALLAGGLQHTGCPVGQQPGHRDLHRIGCVRHGSDADRLVDRRAFGASSGGSVLGASRQLTHPGWVQVVSMTPVSVGVT